LGELIPGVILSLGSPSGDGELRVSIPPKNRIFLALLPKENDSSDAVLDGHTQIGIHSEEIILQGAVPSGCPSFWNFPGKVPQRGAVPSGRSSFKVLPKKDL
jgi:hypothetical protein